MENNLQNYKSWIEINKLALTHNTSVFKSLIGNRILIAVIKANAYGHGLVETAKILVDKSSYAKTIDGRRGLNARINADNSNISENQRSHQRKSAFLWFAVDNIDEALTLRRNGIKNKILVLGYTLNSRLKEAAENNISVVVYNKETILAAEKDLKRSGKKLNVHIKIETGTSRQGVFKKDILNFACLALKNSHIKIEGIYTHYADVENPKSSFFKKQLKEFEGALDILEKNKISIPIKHASCTAAVFSRPETYFDAVRVGIGLYGLYPAPRGPTSKTLKKSNIFSREAGYNEKEVGPRKINLKPALTWKTRVAQIKKIKKGTAVSYDLTERVKKDSTVAVLPVGYYDGFDRGLSRMGEVLIRGKRCKVLGTVCMNMIMIDVSNIKNIKPEDEVVLIGKQGREEITAEEIAEKLNTINYEVVTRINPHTQKVLLEASN